MNPIAKKITPGLAAWKMLAQVKTLKKGGFIVPRIIYGPPAGRAGKSKDAVLVVTGLHLEETSGPLTFLDPKKIKSLINLSKKKNFSLIIYPLINNFGLDYSPKADDRFLRLNKNGINYNDGWGMRTKTDEVVLAERDIKQLIKKYNVKVALSLHEDSLSPGKGYLWTNSVKKGERVKIYDYVRKNIPTSLLLRMTEKISQGGWVEEGLSIVDAKDDGALENWLGDVEKVPTVLSEAPFRANLANRSKFHLEVTKATILTYFQ